MPRTGYYDEEEGKIMSDSPVRSKELICQTCFYPSSRCECIVDYDSPTKFQPIKLARYMYSSPIMSSPSIGEVRAVRTGVQELFDTPISIGSEFSRDSTQTVLDDHVIRKRMATAFENEEPWDMETDSEQEEAGFTKRIATGESRPRAPTPMRPWSKMGRGGGLNTAPVKIIVVDLTNE